MAIHRLQWRVAPRLRNDDADVAVTPRTRALEVFCHWLSSPRQTLVHNNPGKLQSKPFGEFPHVHCKLLKLKAGDFHDRSRASLHQNAAADIPVRAKGVNQQRTALNEVSVVRLHCSGPPAIGDSALLIFARIFGSRVAPYSRASASICCSKSCTSSGGIRATYSATNHDESNNHQRAASCLPVLQHGHPSVFLTNDSAPVLLAKDNDNFNLITFAVTFGGRSCRRP